MTEQLVWLPVWHQAREICTDLKIDETLLKTKICEQGGFEAGKDLNTIYGIILSFLRNQSF